MTPDKSRGRVKTTDPKFANDQIFDLVNVDETSRRIGSGCLSGLKRA